METLIGFAFGYWVGTRQGREGLQRTLDAAREIYASPEARNLAEQALSAARSAAAPLPGLLEKVTGNRQATLRDTLDEVIEARFGRRPAAAA